LHVYLQIKLKKLYWWYTTPRTINAFNPDLMDYKFDANIKEHEFPILTIDNPQTNFISFYEYPILTILEPFVKLSISIEYNFDLGNNNIIELHYLMLDSGIRCLIVQNNYV
jgi:hypothetical protein